VHHSRGQQRGLQRGHTTAIVPSTVEQSLILAFDTRFCSVPPRFFGVFPVRLQPVFTTRKMDGHTQVFTLQFTPKTMRDHKREREQRRRRTELSVGTVQTSFPWETTSISHLLVRLLVRLPRRLEEWREMKERRSGNWISVTGRPIAWVNPGCSAASLFARASAPSFFRQCLFLSVFSPIIYFFTLWRV